jgi:DNA-binding LacI/PurR family transcriptional regulator
MPPFRSRHTLGILTTPAKDIFHSHYHQCLLSGILPRVRALKGRIKIIMMSAKPYKSLQEILTKNGLDGLLILTWRWIHPSIVKLIETTSHNRVLVFNDPVPGLEVNHIYVDADAGMAQAVAHLVKKGRKKIGMLHGPWEVPFHQTKGTGLEKRSRPVPDKKIRVPFIDTQLKVQGFLRALKARRIPCNQTWLRSGDANSEAEGYRVMKKWLREKNFPTAIVCGNDDLAFGALKALSKAGRRVPQDVAIIGFDDNERAKSFTPPLTTVRQPLVPMGKNAVDILIRRIKRPASPIVSRKYLPRLMVRKTA